MSTVYKKLTAQDIAVVPFNAHKQYDFDSSSAASNQITFYNTKWTSESIDIYSSGSASADYINTLKYSQIDHLYYRNFKKDLANRFEVSNFHYLNQKRVLYESANVLSIPTGLYGHPLYQGTFLLCPSSSELLLKSIPGKYPSNNFFSEKFAFSYLIILK